MKGSNHFSEWKQKKNLISEKTPGIPFSRKNSWPNKSFQHHHFQFPQPTRQHGYNIISMMMIKNNDDPVSNSAPEVHDK